jgi:hypothetical protein
MTNRTHFIIRSLLQKSNLSREIFVNNKKKYNLSLSKKKQRGFNHIITRKIHTNYENISSCGKGPGGNGPKLPFGFLFAAAFSAYISSKFNKNKKN